MHKPIRVAAFMSNTGSTVRALIEGEGKYKIACIFSDNAQSKAQEIARAHKIPVRIDDLTEFCREKGVKRSDMHARKEFDARTALWLEEHGIDYIALAGYMSLITKPLIDAYPVLNSHPADLTILNNEGKRRFVGAHAVKDAIDAGEKEVLTCIIQVNAGVDEGPILVRSPKVDVLGRPCEVVQDELRRKGDHRAFVFTLDALASRDLTLAPVRYKGIPQPNGVNMGKILVREDMLGRRDGLSDEEKKIFSDEIAKRAFLNPEVFTANRILSYIPVGKEVDTSFFRDKKPIAIPAMQGDDIIALEDTGEYENNHGFPEPVPRKQVLLDDIDVAFIPGVAFDEQGNRLGRGLGFYDKLLPKMRATKIGLAYDEQMLKRIPAEGHDVRMDFIITQTRVIRC